MTYAHAWAVRSDGAPERGRADSGGHGRPASEEWSRFVASPSLGLESLHARFTTHRYERHTHDFYVIAAVDFGAPLTSMERTSFLTPAGTTMVINPGEGHDGRPADARGYVYRSLYVRPDVVARVADELGGDSDAIVDFAAPVVRDPEVFAAVRSLHRSLFDGRDILEQDVRLLRLLELMVGRYSTRSTDARKAARWDARAERVRDLLHSRFAETLTTRVLAEETGLSRVRLNQLFRQTYGLPLHSYLTDVRLREARSLLRSGMSTAQVAATVGFNDQSHLIRRFKGSYGITPGQFTRAQLSVVQDRPAPRGESLGRTTAD